LVVIGFVGCWYMFFGVVGVGVGEEIRDRGLIRDRDNI
jgi:hypothetical protein